MIVVDTSVWIALFRDQKTPEVAKFDAIEKTSDIIMGDIVLLEILQGEPSDRHAARLLKRLSIFNTVSMLSAELAVQAAMNFRLLRSKGFTVRKTPDLIIGTYCLEQDYALLHADRDFWPMADHLGLRLA